MSEDNKNPSQDNQERQIFDEFTVLQSQNIPLPSLDAEEENGSEAFINGENSTSMGSLSNINYQLEESAPLQRVLYEGEAEEEVIPDAPEEEIITLTPSVFRSPFSPANQQNEGDLSGITTQYNFAPEDGDTIQVSFSEDIGEADNLNDQPDSEADQDLLILDEDNEEESSESIGEEDDRGLVAESSGDGETQTPAIKDTDNPSPVGENSSNSTFVSSGFTPPPAPIVEDNNGQNNDTDTNQEDDTESNNGNNNNDDDNTNNNGNTEGNNDNNTDGNTTPEPLDMALSVRVSNKTDNQNSINSNDGFDLVPEAFGETYTVNGEEMDIGWVKNNASIDYQFQDANTVEVTLQSGWNSVKNIEVTSEHGGNVTVNNFVHADVSLGTDSNESSNITVNGAKRSNIQTGNGDDSITINSYTNGSGWSNTQQVQSQDGDDVIMLTGDKGHTRFNVDAGGDNDTVIIDGEYHSSVVSLGDGNDSMQGTDSYDEIDGGSGSDTIEGGGGGDRITGGAGKDSFVISSDDGHVHITDFGGVGGGGRGERHLINEHDTLKFEGEGMDAANLIVEYDGTDTILTFDGIENFSVRLENFDFTDLDNLSNGHNIIFDGQTTGTDSYDVFNNHNAGKGGIWNKNSTTILNNADNNVKGKNNSDDVINGMDGDDQIRGLKGNDTLRGQSGNDSLTGGKGDDFLDGGSGDDTAIFSGNRADYNVTQLDNGNYQIEDQVANRDGTDIVKDIESFRFKDGEISRQELSESADNEGAYPTPDPDPLANSDNNNGHGNDAGGVDSSNPGNGKGGNNGQGKQSSADENPVEQEAQNLIEQTMETVEEMGAMLQEQQGSGWPDMINDNGGNDNNPLSMEQQDSWLDGNDRNAGNSNQQNSSNEENEDALSLDVNAEISSNGSIGDSNDDTPIQGIL